MVWGDDLVEHYKETRAKIMKDPAWRTKPCVVVRTTRLASESRSTLSSL